MIDRRVHLTLLVIALAGAAALLLPVGITPAWATPAQSRLQQTLPKPRSIKGTVFEDQDRDGEFYIGEPRIPGVLITLTSEITDTLTMTTDVVGNYTFTDLVAGEVYTVTESDLPGYFSTSPNVVAVTASATETRLVNFGDHPFFNIFLPIVLKSQ